MIGFDEAAGLLARAANPARPERVALAEAYGRVLAAPVTARLDSPAADTVARAVAGDTPKGVVIATAELAGVMGAKRTAELIPLCHPLPLTCVAVVIEPDADLPGFRIRAEVRTHGSTGVEMEALTAVSVAALTVVDMVKAVDKGAVITDVRVETKTGGKSGDWSRA